MWWLSGLAMAATMYVQASSLTLRGAPDVEARPRGTLPINSPVQAGAAKGDFTEVEAGNGSKGWVATRFLRGTPLTLSEAMAQAHGPERLAWLQRAAALAPQDRNVLTALEAAYREAGEVGLAAVVAEQIRWPNHLFLFTPSGNRRDQFVIQWRTLSSDRGANYRDENLSPAQRLREGIPEEGWWVLPDAGPAVPAKVVSAWGGQVNDCSGEAAVEVVLDAALPEGRFPVAASRGEPPSTWREGELPALSLEDAVARTAADRAQRVPDRWYLSSAPVGRGWVLTWAAPFDDPTEAIPWVRYEVTADGLWAVGPREDGMVGPLRARRDLDGDGVIDDVTGDGCLRAAEHGGEWFTITHGICCGC